jgi:hypothetical protein
MITKAPFGRSKGKMMLYAVAAEDFDLAIVASNWECHAHGTFGIFDSVPFVFRNIEPVGDQLKLLAGHIKCRMRINFHAEKLAGSNPAWKFECFPARLRARNDRNGP